LTCANGKCVSPPGATGGDAGPDAVSLPDGASVPDTSGPAVDSGADSQTPDAGSDATDACASCGDAAKSDASADAPAD
jgi:hypothetical protein